MSVVGGVIETKSVGLSIGTSGTHKNTEFDTITNTIRLKVERYDGLGNPIYEDIGEWTSDVINLKDNFYDYEKVFTVNTLSGSSTYRIKTRVSSDGVNWDEWIDVDHSTGDIYSDTKQYIQVKIIIEAGFDRDSYTVSEFDSVSNPTNHIDEFEDNTFIVVDNGLRLKRDYKLDMTLDTSLTGEGSLHRKKITRDEWVRIDKLNVKVEGEV